MPDETPSLLLYHSPQSRSTVVRWMLEEVGEPYAIKALNLKAGEQLKPSYLAINPMGASSLRKPAHSACMSAPLRHRGADPTQASDGHAA
jgi:hypothetical protein